MRQLRRVRQARRSLGREIIAVRVDFVADRQDVPIGVNSVVRSLTGRPTFSLRIVLAIVGAEVDAERFDGVKASAARPPTCPCRYIRGRRQSSST